MYGYLPYGRGVPTLGYRIYTIVHRSVTGCPMDTDIARIDCHMRNKQAFHTKLHGMVQNVQKYTTAYRSQLVYHGEQLSVANELQLTFLTV